MLANRLLKGVLRLSVRQVRVLQEAASQVEVGPLTQGAIVLLLSLGHLGNPDKPPIKSEWALTCLFIQFFGGIFYYFLFFY
jgi:hypothetical protein